MPAQPTWFPRLPQILADLRALEQIPYLDRQAFERIFGVRDRRARVLMARFQGVQIGNAWAIDRLRLIEALEALERGEEFQWEQRRRGRVAAAYEQAKREHPGRQVEIRVPVETRFRTLASLPAAIQLAPGELRIRFSTLEDLLTQLFALAQALQNDFAGFQDVLDGETDFRDSGHH